MKQIAATRLCMPTAVIPPKPLWKSHGQTVCDSVHCTPMDVLHRLTYLLVHYQWQELVFNFIKQMHHNVATVYELMTDSTGDKFTQCHIVGHNCCNMANQWK